MYGVNAQKILRENNIEFTTQPVFNTFYGTAIIFASRRIGNKAIKVLKAAGEGKYIHLLSGYSNGEVAIEYFG